MDRHSAARQFAEHNKSPKSVVNGRGRGAVARPARALRGRQIADARGGLGFDGSNEGSSFGVPAAGACHRDDGWSPLPGVNFEVQH